MQAQAAGARLPRPRGGSAWQLLPRSHTHPAQPGDATPRGVSFPKEMRATVCTRTHARTLRAALIYENPNRPGSSPNVHQETGWHIAVRPRSGSALGTKKPDANGTLRSVPSMLPSRTDAADACWGAVGRPGARRAGRRGTFSDGRRFRSAVAAGYTWGSSSQNGATAKAAP